MGISSLFYRLGVAVSVFALVVGCSKEMESEVTAPVTNSNLAINQELGNAELGYRVLGSEALKNELASQAIRRTSDSRSKALLNELAAGNMVSDALKGSADEASGEPRVGSLILGFPLELLGEAQVFGGVVTKLSDKTNETLGRLKLTDLTPIHVITAIGQDSSNQFYFLLQGCMEKCQEGTEQENLLVLPILGIDFVKKVLYVDLATLGEELNLIAMLDPKGEYTKLKTKDSKTVAMDYSLSNLVFDVKTTMVALDSAQTSEVDFTVRWYLKLASHFDQSFVPRAATEGVGYFMTERAVNSKIQRFRLSTTSGSKTVKYFIKNVPTAFQKAFAGAFDEWNEKFEKNVGRKLLSYEFVSATDPRNALLVAGDPRYNIVEWDLDNLAPYGGLGPSIAHQFTGEILTANVLVQGPKIVELYTKWFQASQTAETLMLAGLSTQAQEVLKEASLEINQGLKASDAVRFQVKLGKLALRVTSQMPALEDPLFQREDFEPLPAGYTFQQYMDGYFHDMLAHELGHNLGLRHNFHGNLEAATGAPAYGKVSASIMEYLGRGFRHLDRIGVYDEMAIAYGYGGVQPTQKDLFCTDEDVPDEDSLDKSAECSRDDATRDPFGFLEARLQRAVDLIVNRGSADAPVWKTEDMERELAALVPAIGMYGATAEKTAATWKRFFIGGDRPLAADAVKAYVLDKLNASLCGVEIQSALSLKASEEIRVATRANLAAFTTKVGELLAPLKTYDATQLGCVVPQQF